jgi:hypothetical protein
MLFENIINGVYVELDCLFDTRLSLMYDIDKNIMRDMISTNKYHTRIMDQFGYLSVRLFRTIYNYRNANTLDNPLGTLVNDVIRDYCVEATITAKSYEEYNKINVYVNIYPYNLTEEDIELLRMGISNSIEIPVNVEILYKPYTEINPEFIKNNIGMMIMYDGLLWVEHFTSNGELIKNSLPDVVLMTPMLLHRNLLIKKADLTTFFNDVEKSVAMLIQLAYVPADIFSFRK